MASPITSVKRKEVRSGIADTQNLAEVTKAISENKDAIIKGIDLLRTINDSGALDMMNAFIKHREEALENILREINKPQYENTLENISKLIFYIGTLNVDDLYYFTEKINQGMEEAKRDDEAVKTTWVDLIKILKNPEINRSVTMLLQFLRGMGK